jgi:hypothetical protein
VHTATTEAEQARASLASLQVSVRIEALVHTATTEAEQARASLASLQVSVRIEALVHTATIFTSLKLLNFIYTLNL